MTIMPFRLEVSYVQRGWQVSGFVRFLLDHYKITNLKVMIAAVDLRAYSILVLACIVCVITTVMNVMALRSLDSTPRPKSLPSLEYPNTYIGLENADLYDPTPLPPVHNFPRLLAQINSSDPSLVYLDLHRWSSGFGMIYPPDRQFLVSSQARLSLDVINQYS